MLPEAFDKSVPMGISNDPGWGLVMLLWGLIWGWQVDLGWSLDVPHGGHHLHCHFCCREVGYGVEGYLSAYLEGSTLWESIRNVIGDFRHRSRGFFMLGLEVFGVRLCQMTFFFLAS